MEEKSRGGSVCLKGSLNRPLIVRQSWTAASENTEGRAGLPSRGASQLFSLSSQINKDPRLFSKAMELDQFVVRSRAGVLACSCRLCYRMD